MWSTLIKLKNKPRAVLVLWCLYMWQQWNDVPGQQCSTQKPYKLVALAYDKKGKNRSPWEWPHSMRPFTLTNLNGRKACQFNEPFKEILKYWFSPFLEVGTASSPFRTSDTRNKRLCGPYRHLPCWNDFFLWDQWHPWTSGPTPFCPTGTPYSYSYGSERRARRSGIATWKKAVSVLEEKGEK